MLCILSSGHKTFQKSDDYARHHQNPDLTFMSWTLFKLVYEEFWP